MFEGKWPQPEILLNKDYNLSLGMLTVNQMEIQP